MKVGFDSVCLAAVVDECQALVGGRLQRILQIDPLTVSFGIYQGQEQWLLLSADPVWARAHLTARRPEGIKPPPLFCVELRRRVTDARVVFIRQRGWDRILEIGLDGEEGSYQLVAELMGRHSNLMLADSSRRVVAAAKWVGPKQSRRPILPMQPYEPPPFEPKPPITKARPGDDYRQFEGVSPTLLQLLASDPQPVLEAIRGRRWSPSVLPGVGAYPLPLPGGHPREAFSFAVELQTQDLIQRQALAQAKSSLAAQLSRVRLAREVALADIRSALEAAARAPAAQKQAELILAYQGLIQPGADHLDAWDHDGNPVRIPLRSEMTPLENAQRLFDRAKKAKRSAEEVARQQTRLREDLAVVESLTARLEQADTLRLIEAVREEADRRKYLHKQGAPTAKEERPYEGHQIREMTSPNGWRVLYGATSTANDYLTTKVARPNDWWLHVRGAPSAHVVILTQNQPQRVQKEDLMFAAEVAVRQSPAKHSGYVSVDYTLKKHVRKPRKAAPGLATYTMEKTLVVERS